MDTDTACELELATTGTCTPDSCCRPATSVGGESGHGTALIHR